MLNRFTKLLVLNTMAAGFLFVCWKMGLLDFLHSLKPYEIYFLAFLLIYYLIGGFAVMFGKVAAAVHIANGLPMWALLGTGLTFVKVIVDLQILNTPTLLEAFHGMALALVCNIVGVALMAWIREQLWVVSGEGI